MTSVAPKVTVLMPVYNGARYLRQAINSILRQTYSDFEFLIIDDGSTDTSGEILASYRDSRIRLIQNEKNEGLVHSLNRGISLARGAYIARMDADDISVRDRLATQISYLDNHPDISVVGGWVRYFKSRFLSTVMRVPLEHEALRAFMLFNSPMMHPTVMLRKRDFVGNSLEYLSGYKHIEDYDLWDRAINEKHLKTHNLPIVLLSYRLHGGSVCRMNSAEQAQLQADLTLRQLSRIGILRLDAATKDIYAKICSCNVPTSKQFIDKAEMLFLDIHQKGIASGTYDSFHFPKILAERFLIVCVLGGGLGFGGLKRFHGSAFKPYLKLNWREKCWLLKNMSKKISKRAVNKMLGGA